MAHVLGRKMRLGLCTAVAVLALSFVAPAAVGETADERLDRFELWAECEPMYLLVAPLKSRAEEIGLAREAVQTTVEARLRSARLYSDVHPVQTYLYVNANFVGNAFSIDLEFRKNVLDFFSNETLFAATWSYGGLGTHSEDANYILNSLSQNIDHFLVEYLRVNEEACAKR